MIRNSVLNNLTKYRQLIPSLSQYSNNAINLEKLEKDNEVSSDVIDADAAIREAEIELKRNKSGLNEEHRNLLHDQVPYPEPKHWSHGTLRYYRSMYGKYGASSGVDPSYCWPTKDELADGKEYERVKYPHTIPEIIESSRKARIEKEAAIQSRQKDISEKLKKLGGWMKELHLRTEKKEREIRAAKAKRDKLIEDVRRHFGYTVDPRDERFKELLEKKEREQKKEMKQAKKKEKEEKMIEKLLAKGEKIVETGKHKK